MLCMIRRLEQMKLAAVFLIALCVLGSAPAWAQDDVDADVDIDVDVEDMDEEVGAAHCILYKEIIADNDRVVAERNFTVSYTVFSIGDAACFDVGVSEDVPSSDFEIVDGEPEKFWEEPVEAYVAWPCPPTNVGARTC